MKDLLCAILMLMALSNIMLWVDNSLLWDRLNLQQARIDELTHADWDPGYGGVKPDERVLGERADKL